LGFAQFINFRSPKVGFGKSLKGCILVETCHP